MQVYNQVSVLGCTSLKIKQNNTSQNEIPQYSNKMIVSPHFTSQNAATALNSMSKAQISINKTPFKGAVGSKVAKETVKAIAGEGVEAVLPDSSSAVIKAAKTGTKIAIDLGWKPLGKGAKKAFNSLDEACTAHYKNLMLPDDPYYRAIEMDRIFGSVGGL